MKKIKIVQVKSVIGASKKQKATMVALGLKKINQAVKHTPTPAVQGMLAKVAHLINVV